MTYISTCKKNYFYNKEGYKMRRENRLGYLFILLAIIPVLFIGCKKKTDDVEKTVITVKGSDTMVNLSQKWAEEYMKLHPEVSIQLCRRYTRHVPG